MSQVMKNVGHIPFECSFDIFYTKGSDVVRKRAPWHGEWGFVLIFIADFNLILITMKPLIGERNLWKLHSSIT